MVALINKEISGFFSSLTGYIVIIVFLSVNGLFIWVFPGELNMPDSGYSTLDTLFIIAPWVFMFLVPAVTMRMFAEEKKTGTLELILVRPITDLQIVFAKFISAVVLVLFSLIPTLIYFWSIYALGSPPGNIDTGAVWGSYLGLFFLASCYAAIGVFASSLTDNQVVAFILAVLLAFFFFSGFELIGTLSANIRFQQFLFYLGINEHYKSISRGVADSRDIVYFLSLISFFLFLTRTVLQSRKW